MKKNLLRWRAIGTMVLVAFALCFSPIASAQSGPVTGIVVDAETTEPLVGAVIKVSGGSAVSTDVNGKFTVNAMPTATLQVSCLGYSSQQVAVSGRSNLGSINLRVDAQQLETIVVTGYGGTTTRAKATASIATVPKAAFEVGSYANPSAAIQGMVPGLRVQTTSGRPGALSEITLRGGTNLSGTGSPLVMVDGQLRDNLGDINPEDIESMDVLKDAAATAIYGARANNGVILITTKKGKTGRASVTGSVKVGVNYLQQGMPMANARDYLAYSRMSMVIAEPFAKGRVATLSAAQPYGTGNKFKNADGTYADGNKDAAANWSTMYLNNDNRHKLNDGWEWMIDPAAQWANPKGNPAMDTLIFRDFDWRELTMNDPAVSQDYTVSVSGGSERGSYFASLGYYTAEGLAVDSYYNRLTFLFNGDYQITRWLKAESSINFSESKQRLPSGGDGMYFGRHIGQPPVFRGVNEAGEDLIGALGTNPVMTNPYQQIRDINNKLTLMQAFKINFLPNLYLRANAQWMYIDNTDENFTRDYLSSPNKYYTSRASSAAFSRSMRQTYNAVLNYDTDFGGSKHNFTGLLGFEYFDVYDWGLSASGKNAPTDDFADLAYTEVLEGSRVIDTNHSQQRIMSLLGRFNYDYDGKYIATFTFRQDGYSRLLGDQRWGFFPGISAAWNISREGFMESSRSWLDLLKIRTSWGQNGNVGGVGIYELQGSYSASKYQNQTGFGMGALPNPNLRWEKSGTFEVAAEASFLGGRITTSLAYYNRVTEDLIANIGLPGTAGITSLKTNNGSVQNYGIEWTGHFVPISTKNWKWSIDANLSWNENKVVKLPMNGNENNRQGGTQIWDPASQQLIWVGGNQEGRWGDEFVGMKFLGIWQSDEQIAKEGGNIVDRQYSQDGGSGSGRAKGSAGPTALAGMSATEQAKYHAISAGDARFEDRDGNDTLDWRDRQVLGRSTPRFYGGLSTSVAWKGITLYVRTDFALGHVQYDWSRDWYLGNKQGAFGTIADVTQTWTPTNPTAKYPAYYYGDQTIKNNYRYSSMLTNDASYLALREVALSYTFPAHLISKASMQGLTVGITAQNVGYLTAAKTAYGPEVGGVPTTSENGSGYGRYQLPLTLLFSAKVTF